MNIILCKTVSTHMQTQTSVYMGRLKMQDKQVKTKVFQYSISALSADVIFAVFNILLIPVVINICICISAFKIYLANITLSKQVELEKVAIAIHCNLRRNDTVPHDMGFNYETIVHHTTNSTILQLSPPTMQPHTELQHNRIIR